MRARTPTAALRYEADAYVQKNRIMGRQAAGSGFLRAAVEGRDGDVLWGYTPQRGSAASFADEVAAIDSAAEAKWCPAHRLDTLEAIGTLYLPGPDLLLRAAELRLRRGAAAYSLCGVTHTTASHRAMDGLTGLLTAPVERWDALICTSSAVLETVETQLAAAADYLKWRFGTAVAAPRPQIPVIPLGVHCADFDFSAGERAAARAALGLGEDEILILYVGRLAFHAKAHPDAMYAGVEAAARASGRRIVLLQAGWFANASVEASYKEGAAAAAPSVDTRFGDGQDPGFRRTAWAAADIFISLADNIQETFGLTPIEAMAAGLPVVVSDWDGYKDSVHDGVHGFRIPTWMAGSGDAGLALRYESGTYGYDRYCGLSCQSVAIDLRTLGERLTRLVGDPGLRRRMGEQGRQRARADYDWRGVYARYRALWDELAAIRRMAAEGEQPRLAAAPPAFPSRLAPAASFGHYPTERIGAATRIVRSERLDGMSYAALTESPLFSYADSVLCDGALADAVLAAAAAPIAVGALARRLGRGESTVICAVAVLAKMGLLRPEPGGGEAEPEPSPDAAGDDAVNHFKTPAP